MRRLLGLGFSLIRVGPVEPLSLHFHLRPVDVPGNGILAGGRRIYELDAVVPLRAFSVPPRSAPSKLLGKVITP